MNAHRDNQNKVIVTGATGFIGSWFTEELLKNNYRVSVVVRDPSKLISSVRENPNTDIICGSLDDLDCSKFDNTTYEVFYHLAWNGVSPENKNDIEIQMSNIRYALNAIEVAHKLGCKRFIALGTVAEYALCDDVMNFNFKPTPNDIYAATKVAVYNYLNVRARQLGQDFNWIIVPSTFGERRMDNNIITYTIRSLLNGDKPKYGDLFQMWDFLYVSEVARAIRLIGERGIPGKIYGIGSGKYRPLKDYIEKIRDIINPNLELGIGEVQNMSKQSFSSCVNIYDLIRDTGFIPNVSFEVGITKTVEWFRRNMNGFSR